jgi:hypothetical protein
LIEWFRANTNLQDSTRIGGIGVEQKVFIFIYITAQGVAFRNAAEMFRHSLDTISKAFHEVLTASLLLYKKTVELPTADYSSHALSDNGKIWPFFRGCIGALDGTHLPIAVSLEQQGSWRN